MRTRVKFCGCTSLNDAKLAVDAGADAIGLIFAESPRRITLDLAEEIVNALPPFVTPVGVFVDPSDAETGKIHEALPSLLFQILRKDQSQALQDAKVGYSVVGELAKIRAQDEVLLLFDTKVPGLMGGTGETFSWNVIEAIARERRIGVAGGLTPENVGACIRQVRPYFVDVRSGIETGGKKDAAKMRAFIEAVREAE